MELILVRHGEPARGAGQANDPGLHERGERQGKLLGAYLAAERIDAVYTSPLRRARQTAEFIADATGNEVLAHRGLVEFDHNAAEYISIEELRASGDPRYQQILNDDYTAWGIDIGAFRRGVVGTLEEIVAAHAAGAAAVVCHGGVVNAYLGWVLGLRRFTFFPPFHSSVHRVRCSRSGQRTLISLNEVAHLRGHDLIAY